MFFEVFDAAGYYGWNDRLGGGVFWGRQFFVIEWYLNYWYSEDFK